jgi:hypothetical protein
MTAFDRYYAEREPVLVFHVEGYERFFVAYDQATVAGVTEQLKTGTPIGTVYRELCARSLAGDPALSALPKGSPPWARGADGHWRPCELQDTGG